MFDPSKENSPLVCLIDDDLSVRESLSNLLRSAGLNIETFSSAEEFLASARLEALACLLVDVQLPGITGLDLQQRLLSSEIKIPIIFLTGHGDIPVAVRAVKAGALEFLTKPFDNTVFLMLRVAFFVIAASSTSVTDMRLLETPLFHSATCAIFCTYRSRLI